MKNGNLSRILVIDMNSFGKINYTYESNYKMYVTSSSEVLDKSI